MIFGEIRKSLETQTGYNRHESDKYWILVALPFEDEIAEGHRFVYVTDQFDCDGETCTMSLDVCDEILVFNTAASARGGLRDRQCAGDNHQLGLMNLGDLWRYGQSPAQFVTSRETVERFYGTW